MKKLLIVLFTYFFAQINVYSDVLTGGLIYNVENLKRNSLKKVVKELPAGVIKGNIKDSNFYKNRNALKSSIAYTDRELAMFDLGDSEVYAVCFKNDPKYTYFYENDSGKLKSVAIEEKTNTFPKVQYYYNSSGIFTHLIIKVSKSEAFIYNREGKLNSHWIGDRAYDKDKKLIGVAYRVHQVD